MIIRAAQDSKAAIQEKAGSKIVLEITKEENNIKAYISNISSNTLANR